MNDDTVKDDTVKIERPMCCRRHQNVGGRMRQNSLGKSVKVRTRAQDGLDAPLLERTVNMESGSAD
jgi:hypothetical protein